MTEMMLRMEYDDEGRITGTFFDNHDSIAHGAGATLISELTDEIAPEELAHNAGDTLISELEGEVELDELAHFGVKGMKWGRTRERGPNGRVSGKSKPTDELRPDETSPQVGVLIKGNQIVGTVGGRGIAPHSDAVNAKVVRQKIAGSGLNSVSNKELQDYVTRVNLEQNFARLNPKTASKGQQYARTFGTESAKLVGGVAKDIARESLKTAIKSGIDSAIKK